MDSTVAVPLGSTEELHPCQKNLRQAGQARARIQAAFQGYAAGQTLEHSLIWRGDTRLAGKHRQLLTGCFFKWLHAHSSRGLPLLWLACWCTCLTPPDRRWNSQIRSLCSVGQQISWYTWQQRFLTRYLISRVDRKKLPAP